MSLSTTIKSIQDIMRKDVGVDGDAQRIEYQQFGAMPDCGRHRIPFQFMGKIGDGCRDCRFA